MHIGHVETFAKKFGIAKDFNFAGAEIFNELSAFNFGRFAVAMGSTDTFFVESVSDLLRMFDVDAIANGRFTGGVAIVIVNDIADDFFIAHDFCKVGVDVFAKFCSHIVQINFISVGKISKIGEVAELNKLVNVGTFNHGSEDVAEIDAAHALRRGSDTQKISIGIGVENLPVSVSENMVTLVADKEIGRGHSF